MAQVPLIDTDEPREPPSPRTLPNDPDVVQHWRSIFPRYVFAVPVDTTPTRSFTAERPPGVPSVSTFSISSPQSPAKPESTASTAGAQTLRIPQGPVHPLTKIIPPIYRTDEPENVHKQRRFFYNAAVGVCIACPLLIITPPRKLDLFTFGLGATFFLAAGFVTEQRTGQGMLWHVGYRMTRLTKSGREFQDQAASTVDEQGGSMNRGAPGDGPSLMNTKRRERWIEEKMRKEKEALEEGRGYGSLIGSQIMEVFGLKSVEDDDEDDDEDGDLEKGSKDNKQ